MNKEKLNVSDIGKEFIHVVKINYNLSKSILPINITKNLLIAAVPYVGIWYGCLILDGLLSGDSKASLMPLVYQFALITMVLTITFYALDRMGNMLRDSLRQRMSAQLANKACTMDYSQLENQESMQLLAAAEEGDSASGGMYWFSDRLGTLVGDIASVVYAFVVLFPLLLQKSGKAEGIFEVIFTSQISIYVLFILDFVCMFLFFQISNRANDRKYQIYQTSLDATRKDEYYYREILGKYQYGKEIRLYHMQDSILNDMKNIWEDKCSINQQRNNVDWKMQNKYILIQVGLLFVAYLMVGSRGVLGYITAAQVVKYVAVLTALSTAFELLVSHYAMLLLNIRYLDNYYIFLNLPSYNETGTRKVDLTDTSKLVFEFHDVSFKYPNNDTYSLEHINLTFDYGEKTAIVGRNGAGKTTLIMLLCRLYRPTNGYITLNGVDIAEYDFKSYRDLFGIVFQDFKLFAMNVAENVAAGSEYDTEKVKDCLTKAGIIERVNNMDNGIETHLYNVGEEGVEVSGGEAQKIAIARALYKDAPFIILDEPTSALDPVSEYEIYSCFDELVQNKTAIYISHRMSSCRFCDRIIVLSEGGVGEQGSHEELLSSRGIYSTLWNAQAQYYN